MARHGAAPGRIVATAGDFVLSFAYDPALVRAVRLIPGRRYDPVGRTWRIPRTPRAAQALLALAHEHDIAGRACVEQAARAERGLPHPSALWWTRDAEGASPA